MHVPVRPQNANLARRPRPRASGDPRGDALALTYNGGTYAVMMATPQISRISPSASA